MNFGDPIATVFQVENIGSRHINPTQGLQLLHGEPSDDSEALQTVKEPTIQGSESCLEKSIESSEALKKNTSSKSAKVIEHGESNNLISLSDDHNITEVLVDESDTHHLKSEQSQSSFTCVSGKSKNIAVETALATCRPTVEVHDAASPIKTTPAEGINGRHDDGGDENKAGRLHNDPEEDILTTNKGDEQCRAAHVSRGTTHPATINNQEKETHCREDETDRLKSSTQ